MGIRHRFRKSLAGFAGVVFFCVVNVLILVGTGARPFRGLNFCRRGVGLTRPEDVLKAGARYRFSCARFQNHSFCASSFIQI
uniref:Putative secreted protein n=1 Tax=Ixodes ricinus TaxID=34613 RepID=A0A6B0U8S1_IXORI